MPMPQFCFYKLIMCYLKGEPNSIIKATVTSIDLPYDSNYNCYHWLEFRDYLIDNDGKDYVVKCIFLRKNVYWEDKINLSNILWTKWNERTKITNSNQSHESYRKYKSENGRTWTSEFIRSGIRCHGGVSIPCWLFLYHESDIVLEYLNNLSFDYRVY
jgi:hypothetical protein